MRNTKHHKDLKQIEDVIIEYANAHNRTLPEIRFFVLNENEFLSLLEKNVYPVSPPNIYEGQNIIKRKQRVSEGLESSLYYEVVQTGRPSYAYLNYTNSYTTQASVMAHVVGHCEFSEINVMKDSSDYRTEYIMYLSKKVKEAKRKMGNNAYKNYWFACESSTQFINADSQFNLKNSVETLTNSISNMPKEEEKVNKAFMPFSSTINNLIKPVDPNTLIKNKNIKKNDDESISRKGYSLKFPCQDVFGFLLNYAPTSESEKNMLEYLYHSRKPHNFVRKTQIMNEGWAMYWEKKIMMDVFKDNRTNDMVNEIIDYSSKFSGVLYPRPFFRRNPYHLGYNMWNAIQKDFEQGKISCEYNDEKDLAKKENWNKPPNESSLEFLESIVKSCTDYEFLRRYLTHDRVEEFHLNKVDNRMGHRWPSETIKKQNEHFTWLYPEVAKEWMLNYLIDFYQPRIYIINDDYLNGGLLLYHRNSSSDQKLRKDWIEPTLKNISYIWKNSVFLLDGRNLHCYEGNRYEKISAMDWSFEEIVDIMRNGEYVSP